MFQLLMCLGLLCNDSFNTSLTGMTCLCVGLVICTSLYMHEHIGFCVCDTWSQKLATGVIPQLLSTSFFEAWSLTEHAAHPIGWAPGKCQGLHTLPLLVSAWSRDLSAGPQACMTGTLLTKPSAQSSNTLMSLLMAQKILFWTFWFL